MPSCSNETADRPACKCSATNVSANQRRCYRVQVPVKEGGTILGGQGEAPDSSSGAFGDVKPRYTVA